MSTPHLLVSEPTQQLLAQLAISLKEVAEAIGVSYETVRGWSYGRSDPTAENRAKLVAFANEHRKRLNKLARDLECSGPS